MSETQQPEAAGQGEAVVGSPLLLKQAREAAGLHVAALAAALKVPVRKLEDLEAGRFDRLPDMTFARALASSACRHLKIDPAPVLAQLPAAARPVLGMSGTALNAPFQGGADPVPFNPAGWLSRPAVLAAIALLLGALVIVFLPKADEPAAPVWGDAAQPPAPAPVPVAGPAVATEGAAPGGVPAPAAEPVAETGTAATPALAPAVSSLTAAAAPVAVPAPAVVPSPVPASVPASVPAPAAPAAAASLTAPATASTSAPAVMAVAARGETWIEVTTPAGETVVRRLLNAGESMEVNRAPPYAVVIGRAEAARVTLRGQSFELPPASANGVARFEVK